jgi:hypothetical protein
MHWRMGVPHSDAAFGLPVIQVSVMPCHDDFLSGGDEEPYLQAVSRGCRADPIPVREPLCRVACIARRLFRGEPSGSAPPYPPKSSGKSVFCQVGPARWFAYSPPVRVRRSNVSGGSCRLTIAEDRRPSKSAAAGPCESALPPRGWLGQ